MWGLTRNGRSVMEHWHDQFRSRTKRVTPCFLWRLSFKQLMCPGHALGPEDAKRPVLFYRDLGWQKILRELLEQRT
jgi:hypothetical protein